VREREVSRAAVGACRSRGGRAETVFVVAYCARAASRRATGAGGASRRGSKVGGAKGEEEGKAAGEYGSKKDEPAKVESSGEFDDDFAMLADFTALDEAFGGGSTEAEASKQDEAAAAAPEVNGSSARELEEEKEELERWARALEGDEMDAQDEWRVELAEVKVEMAAIDGPRASSSFSESPSIVKVGLTL